MSSTTTTCLSPPPTFNTLDPFQRARLLRSTRKIGRVFGTTPIFLDCPAPREVHSLDLNVNQLLPIGPHASGSGSRSSTPSPKKGPIDKLKTRAARRQGSLLNVPVTQNTAANESSSSLSSVSSQTSVTSVGSLREARGFSAARHRKADIPAPLVLEVNTVPFDGPDHTLGSPTPLIETPRSFQLAHRRSRSMSATLSSDSSSSAGVPTPLTPSFRFRATTVPSHRRQKLQKLARTLGENIPPALVFPSYPYPDLSAPATPVSERPDTTFGATYANKTSATTAARGQSITKGRASRRRRASVGMLHALHASAFPPASISEKDAKGTSRWEPPAEWALGPSDTVKQGDQDEEQLLGMWNSDNYDSVMDRLRLLKN